MKKIFIFLFLISIFHFNYAQTNETLIKQGQNYISSLYNKNTQTIPISDNKYLESIVSIMYFLCSKVPEKNSGEVFSSGTIMIEDENWKLHQFLLNYVKQEFGEIKKEIWISTKNAYPRHSTHFNNYYLFTNKAIKKGPLNTIKKTTSDYFHYGIDIRTEDKLPVETKKHILFGKVGEINDKQFIFIKFEKVGLKSKDAFEHALELIKYKIKDQIPALQINLLEKLKISLPDEHLLQETLNQISQNINPKNSLTLFRRETVPLGFMGEYMALMFSKESEITDKKLLEEIKEKANAFGVQEIVKTAQDFSQSKQGTPKWRKALTFFVEEIKKQYLNDWEFRFGNEIILMQSDF